MVWRRWNMPKTVFEVESKNVTPEQDEAERAEALPRPELRVYMLGPPSVEWAGCALDIPRRQVRAVLYRLATPLTPLPREHLCNLFWRDIPERTARRNLSHVLTHLRGLLPAPEVLLCTDDTIALDLRRAWSDAVTFDQLCLALREPSLRLKALEQAAALYRGSFLAGFSLLASPEFELWADLERSAQERRYLETLAALVAAQAAQGKYPAAIECARRYLAIDDLAEEMHRRLMTLYAAIGDRGAALHQFELCTLVLERELGVGPLPETRAVYQTVLAGRSPALSSAASPPPAWTTLPSLEAPLVGRDQALRQLARAYISTRAGRGSVVLIAGEPGIGKSRLLQEFVTSLAAEATVVAGAGHENEQNLAYGLLIEALAAHLRTIDLVRPGFEPLDLALLAGLWPGLLTRLPEVPSLVSLDQDQKRTLLFQALVRVLLHLAARRPPLLLCVDNLHWADASTLAWLGCLARHLRRAPILVLGTYRPEEAATVARLRTELVRLGLLQEIGLTGLSPPEIVQLIRHLSSQDRGAAKLSQRLHRETGGNPFFLLETLRFLFETGLLWQDDRGWSTPIDKTTEGYHEPALPGTIYEVVRARLRRLSSQIHQVLEAGAVIGSQFEFDLLQAASGRAENEVVEALEALLARQLLTEQDGRYRFNHDLIRAVVYYDLSYGRRRLLHRRVGEALEKLRANYAVALAWHFERAEEPGRAARYAWQAGLAAKTIFAHAEARTHFERALSLLKQEATHLRDAAAIKANLRLQVHALAERGWALRLLGEMEAYASDLSEVTRLAEQLGDPGTLAHLRWREAYAQRWFCRYAAARQAAAQGLGLSKLAAEPLLEALCLRELGLAARESGDYQPAQLSLEQALERFVDLGQSVYQIHTLCNLSTLHWRRAEFERATNLARQALACCEEVRLTFERRLPLGDLGAAAVATGEVDLARQWLLESLAIARQIADRTQEIFCLGHLGRLCLKLKQPAKALEFLQTALALAESIDSGTEQSWLRAGLAEVHWLDGKVELAVEHAQQALKLAHANGRPYDQALARRVLAELDRADW
jgi:DNA-binding SARP family transcriptional activator